MSQRVAASRFAVYLVLGVMSLPLSARADQGHSLLGVGAVNSAMGGAGVALANDPLGALLLNPALLPRLDGNRFELSLEVSSQDSAVESRVGPFSGRTEGTDEAVLPAFAWTRHAAGSRAAFGAGVLPLSGFGVDYPQDSTNPSWRRNRSGSAAPRRASKRPSSSWRPPGRSATPSRSASPSAPDAASSPPGPPASPRPAAPRARSASSPPSTKTASGGSG